MAKKGQKFIFIDEDLIKKVVKEKIYGRSYSYLSEKNTISSITEDPYMLDQICLFEQGELTDEEQKEIIAELFNEFKNQIPNNWETQQYESAIHTVMEMVSRIIPELFLQKLVINILIKNITLRMYN